ncbi:MAG: TrbI/VirB10 family protein [Hyphomicrobium sp.]
MTDANGADVPTPGPGAPKAKVSPESLELRARPQPVTRINRKVLIGGAAIVMVAMAGLVLVALKAPSFRTASPSELYNVDRKPITDRLAGLPATYDGFGGRQPPATQPPLTSGVRQLQIPSVDPVHETERVEKARLARMAGQAREAPLFFQLQMKTSPRDAPVAATEHRTGAAAPIRTASSDGDLANLTALRATERGRADSDADPLSADTSDQTRKLSFLSTGPEKEIYNPHSLQTPASPYQLMAGTIISASLVSGLSSDLPGFVIAQVTENVFDSVAGRHLLIPQGSRLVGKYDNLVAFGQERALVIWQRIILPDGSSVVIDSLPATDTGGYAGLSDKVDPHTWKLLKGIALATVLGIGNSLASGNTDSDILKALRESTGQTTSRAGQRLVEKNLNVQPTLTVRPGWPLRIIVHKDIVLRPYRISPAK